LFSNARFVTLALVLSLLSTRCKGSVSFRKTAHLSILFNYQQTDLTNLNYFITSKVVSNLEKEQKEKFRIFSKPVFDVPENRELTQSMH